MSLAPKVFSKALSANSPTTRGRKAVCTVGSNGYVEFVGRTCDTAFIGDDPKVIQMLVIEWCAHGQVF